MDVKHTIINSAVRAATYRTVRATGLAGSLLILWTSLFSSLAGRSAEQREREDRKQRKITADAKREEWRKKWYHPDGTPR